MAGLAWALAAMAPVSANDWKLEGEAAFVSDYRWRGVSLSDEEPSLQAEATLAHASGAWAWGNVNSVSDAYGGSEFNLGLGFTREIGAVSWTIGALRYLYPGEDDLDYTEIDLYAEGALGPVWLSGGVEYAPENDNYGDDDTYLWLGWEIEAPRGFTLHGHIGRDDGVMAPTARAVDYSIGAGAPLGPFAFDLSYVEVETEDGAMVARLSYAFERGAEAP
jgi:uncharacterized protein (TIGR02001 family)